MEDEENEWRRTQSVTRDTVETADDDEEDEVGVTSSILALHAPQISGFAKSFIRLYDFCDMYKKSYGEKRAQLSSRDW